MQIVICDDLAEERRILREQIHRCGSEFALDYVIEEFENAESLLAAVKSGKVRPDILFMDIYMTGMSGMDGVKQLKNEGFRGAVIFTTTSRSHAVESYDMLADGYLVKPYSKEKFHINFRRAVQRYTESFKTISFLCNRLEFRVFLKDLEYIESEGRGSILHAKGERLKTSKSVSEFAQELLCEDYFLRSHQGCVVNLNFVAKVEADHILMKSGEKAPLAVKDRTAVKKTATDYFFLKMWEEESVDA